MRARYAIATTALLAGISCGKTPKETPPIGWYSKVAPACAAAAAQHKPVLFVLAANWDVVTAHLDAEIFADPRIREEVTRDWIPLRVDRSNTYMNDDPPPDEEREVEEARRRFRPWASKYGSLVLVKSDCATEIDRIDAVFDPIAFRARLRAAKAQLKAGDR